MNVLMMSKIFANSGVGTLAWIGAGATVINGIEICDNVMIGAGATVINSICEVGTYVGVPAKKLK